MSTFLRRYNNMFGKGMKSMYSRQRKDEKGCL
jgi:hypothetical protein